MIADSVHNEIQNNHLTTAKGLLSLSPIVVFLILYPITSLLIGDFYKVPLTVAFIGASAWGFLTARHLTFSQRVEAFSRSAGSSNIIYMVWIFILAGAFSSLAEHTGAISATVNLTLRFLPYELLIPGLFLAACFISLSIGTSVGTVVALTPLAIEIAAEGGGDVALFVATVLGGAFFGDNLSFISDTTIAATRSQNVAMNAKFKANLVIVLPAAIVTLIVYVFIGAGVEDFTPAAEDNYFLILPYLLIIALAIAGVNVIIVLAAGITASTVIALMSGFTLLDLAGFTGEGIDSMGSLIIITLLSAGMLGLVKTTGGIDWLLEIMTRHVRSSRGAKAVIASLVSVVNVCTANNTVAILTVGPLSRKISERYDIGGARTASLLDTCSCIVQCLLPYGAQTLLAVGMAGISPAAPWPYLYYPWALGIGVIAMILYRHKRPVNIFST